MRQGIDISDIEEETKIRAKFLRALENEEWAVIPDEVYVRKFLETYARALKLDPRPLVELYVIRSGAPDATTGRQAGEAEAGWTANWPRIAAACALAALTAVLILALGGKL